MRAVRTILATAALVAASFTAPAPAWAAAPGNDTSAGATPAAVGFSEVLDTSEATTDDEDAQLNESCGAPATDASVWYTVVGTGSDVVVDVSGSDYPAGVLVGVGAPGALETVMCGPGTVGFLTDPGTTYFVLAIDDQSDQTGNGGMLQISIEDAPAPPTVEVTVDPRGTFDARTGQARLTGSYTCSGADFVEIFGDVTQSVGRFAVRGFFDVFDVDTCDGTPQRWSANVVPDGGKFAGGRALTVAFSFACGAFDCDDSFVEQTVRLTGRRR